MLKKLLALTILIPALAQSACPQVGPNRFQPAPILTSATRVDGVVTVSGRVSTVKRNATYLIQFFGNPANRNPITEGADYLGETRVTTDCFGVATFSLDLPVSRNEDPFLSATATLVLCDGTLSDTSEFSLNIPIA